ncbi:class I SAM-dependent methyltransferase [Stenotrophomonas mori]|uniref:Class I SAM-dependent methyltransferase n=1 Tax=Stenotrophomonas mori TaxID=2871096 RepID=A0ABT0SFA6_9GAMM|nr:class I SAM-dependent methyltransferase [Stenotrophomonas mori]MCL7713690.1 class I SAM-dependent methyltransferase [Stenotrophomonas mori]
MNPDELTSLFDRQAAGYDAQWARTRPIRDCLHLLLDAAFATLPENAHILCVGLGTGAELRHLARNHPGWRFTAVEPSGAMLAVCRQAAEDEGIAARCHFHEGYLDTLAGDDRFDAATCFLVSQFILEPVARSGFFRGIARRLVPGGILASSDLASDVASPGYEALLRAWMALMAAADVPADALQRMRDAYARDVAMLPPEQIASIIAAGGFQPPVPFFQAGLIHGWLSRRGDPAR